MESAGVVNLVDEAGKVGCDILEGFVCHQIYGFDLQCLHEALGLGGIGSLFRTAAAIKRDMDVVRNLTTRPFALNHIPQKLVSEAFDYALAARPVVMSFALADPGYLARRARDVGSRIMIQVTTVAQAVQAAFAPPLTELGSVHEETLTV